MNSMKRCVAMAIAAAVVAACGAGIARADTVIKKDGTQYEGRIVRESPGEVVIETTIHNIKSELKIPRKDIEKIVRSEKTEATPAVAPTKAPEAKPAPAKESESPPDAEASGQVTAGTYLPIPIKGEIGKEVVVKGIESCLQTAKRRGVKHVVFMVDSPGGFLGEAYAIRDLLKEYSGDIQFHAFVDGEAISAATIFLAGSRSIFMPAGSSTGGATAFTQDRTTGDAKVDAKQNSIWAADLASVADRNGHPGVVFEAMVIMETRLFVWKQGDKFEFRDQPPIAELKLSATEIDTKDTTLTFRAADAIKWGFARSISGGHEAIGPALGIDGWTSLGKMGEQLMTQSAAKRKALVDKIEEFGRVVSTNLKLAKQHDPGETEITYFEGSGELTPESQKRWRTAVDKSLKLWREIKDAFKDAEKLEGEAKAQGADYLLPIVNKEIDVLKIVEERIDWLQRNRNKKSIR